MKNLLPFVGFVLATGTAQAAETVKWNDLALKLAAENVTLHEGYRIFTTRGEKLAGDSLNFTDLGVYVMPSDAYILREDVKEIRVSRRRTPLREALLAPAIGTGLLALILLTGTDNHVALAIGYCVDVPVMAAEVAVGAPIVLTIQGVKRLLPDKVIRVMR